jgi:UDP-3-O-[3-hydroxymyristoyl] glucosamine N-acyltransferase
MTITENQKNKYKNYKTDYIIILQFLLYIYHLKIINKMNGHAILVSVGIMALFAAATTITTTIGMTNTTGNEIGLLLVEAQQQQQQQNANGVTIGNCVTIGDNTTLASSVTIGDNSTIAENVRIDENTKIGQNVRIDENTKIGENITMTSGGQMDGNASSPITSPQNATAVPVNTRINISC